MQDPIWEMIKLPLWSDWSLDFVGDTVIALFTVYILYVYIYIYLTSKGEPKSLLYDVFQLFGPRSWNDNGNEQSNPLMPAGCG